MRINNIVLNKPAQIGETPEMDNSEGKVCMYSMVNIIKDRSEYIEDLTGQKFGQWTVVERAKDKTKSRGAKWLCECSCGIRKVLFGKNLKNGKSKSCGCGNRRTWVGERFGKLVIQKVRNENNEMIFECLCDCGNNAEVIGTSIYGTKSCGCSRIVNRVGEKYGMLQVDEMLPGYRDGITYASCTCDCGNSGFITRINGLISGTTKSCGCIRTPNLIGRRFGRLVVEKQINSITPQRRWLCKCDCGGSTEALSYWLTSGHVKSCGCLRSESNSYMESVVRNILNDYNVSYLAEHSFEYCIGTKGWKLRFDFYIPDKNIVIECDGEQHYRPVSFFGGDEKFATQIENDKIKDEYCLKNKIELIRIPYTKTESEIKEMVESLLHTKIP